MTSQAQQLDAAQRRALIGGIAQHLNHQDDQTLLLLADLVRQTPQELQSVSVTERAMSRRRFLTATLASSFVAAAAGSVAIWQYGTGRSNELKSQLQSERDTILHLWGLIHLHEKLDEGGLDQSVATGLAAVGAALEAIAGAIELVRAGIQVARDALIKFETALPVVRAGFTWLESWAADLARRLHLLEDAIGRAVDEVNPITQALGSFLKTLLTPLPPEGAQKIREVFDRVGEVVGLIPKAITDINVKILAPLRDDWFSDSPGKGIKGGLFDPITGKLLTPLEDLLGRQSQLARQWEADLVTPAKAAFGQREAVRQEIANYKARFALQEPSAPGS